MIILSRIYKTQKAFMIAEDESFDYGFALLPTISRNSQEKTRNLTQPSECRSTSLYKYISQMNSQRQVISESMNMKSERYNEIRFSQKRQRQTLKSLKNSFHKNNDPNKSNNHQQFTNSNQLQTFRKQSRVKQYCTKNSLMNKLISQHKKANKINFQDTKSQLFVNFRKSGIYMNQSISEIKNFTENSNDKITALLSDRPFKKTSPLKCNLGKLKMAQNIKQLAKRNVLCSASFNQNNLSTSKDFNLLKETQCRLFTSNLKNNQSLRSIQKPFIRTDLLKACVKSSNKFDRLSNFQKQERHIKKKSVLLISDDEMSQMNFDPVISEQSIKSKRILSLQKQILSQHTNQSRQKRCQQKIISDLIKLQQMKNRQSYAEHKILQLKSSRIYAQNFKQVKSLIKDKNQQRNQKIKYVVKFKTEPKQNLKQKLQSKINGMVPQIQTLRNKLMKETKFEDTQISGFAQTLKQRPLQMSERIVREPQKERNSMARKSEWNLMQKQVSGWDIQKQTEGRDQWNFNY